jgi:hypothetical protein
MDIGIPFMSAISDSFSVTYLTNWCTTQLNKTNSLLKPERDCFYNNANYKIRYDYNLINYFMSCFNFQYNEGKLIDKSCEPTQRIHKITTEAPP